MGTVKWADLESSMVSIQEREQGNVKAMVCGEAESEADRIVYDSSRTGSDTEVA